MTRLVVLLLIVAALEAAQAYIESYKECTESNYAGPLASHEPVRYALSMDIMTKGYIRNEMVDIDIKADYSANPQEPRDVIVVHADSSVGIGFIVVKRHSESSTIEDLLPIDTICRDSAKQLLVIKLENKLDTKQDLVVNFHGSLTAREDQRGLHRVKSNQLRANFGNHEARLIMPCFDDPKYKAVFKIDLQTRNKLQASSDILKVDTNKRTKLEDIPFAETEPLSFDSLSFDLRPKRRFF